MLIIFLFFVAGFIALWKGADFFVKGASNISLIFSLFQNIIILYYLLRGPGILNNFNIFIKKNPLIVLGLFGCFITSFIKQDIIQIRYFSYSLIEILINP